jgi:hypothetical protein
VGIQDWGDAMAQCKRFHCATTGNHVMGGKAVAVGGRRGTRGVGQRGGDSGRGAKPLKTRGTGEQRWAADAEALKRSMAGEEVGELAGELCEWEWELRDRSGLYTIFAS